MLQPRTILLRARRAGWIESSFPCLRHFSTSRKCFENNTKPQNRADGTAQTKSSRSSASTQSRRTNIPPTNLNSQTKNLDRPRPRRIVDARSLAASNSNGQPINILRSPGLRNARGGLPPRNRGSRTAKPTTSKNQKSTRGRRRAKQSDIEEGDDVQKTEIENVYHELAERTKPTPTRYEPQPPSLHNLSETWPSLPIGPTANAAGVIEKLSSLSGRSPNGYIPPQELGKRLFEGQYVRFLSEEERSESLAVAKGLAREYADKVSQEKGDLVDPLPVSFKRVDEKDQKSLIQSLVQGKYPTTGIMQANKSPVLVDVLRNLGNNETYQAAGKSSQFVAKLESLLASKRPVKRA